MLDETIAVSKIKMKDDKASKMKAKEFISIGQNIVVDKSVPLYDLLGAS